MVESSAMQGMSVSGECWMSLQAAAFVWADGDTNRRPRREVYASADFCALEAAKASLSYARMWEELLLAEQRQEQNDSYRRVLSSKRVSWEHRIQIALGDVRRAESAYAQAMKHLQRE